MRLSLALALSVIVGVGCGSSTGLLPGGGGSSAPGAVGSAGVMDGSGGASLSAGTGGVPGAGGAASGAATGGAPGQDPGTGGAAAGGTTGQASGGSGPSRGGTTGHGSGGSGAASGGTGGNASGSGGTSSGGGTGGGTGNPGSGGAVAPGTGGMAAGSGGATGHGTGGSAGHASGGAGGAPAPGSGGTTSSGSGGTTSSGGSGGTAGNPDGSCAAGVPAGGQPADVSNPTTVVGSGSADSCTFAALSAAIAKAGVITFNCGSAPVTIAVTATLNLSTTKDTVIDGGDRVTLDGGHAVQIMTFNSSDFQANETRVTLQYLTVVNAKTTPTSAIPAAPEAACSQGFDDGQGGALFMRDGNLTVIDCVFSGNQAAPLGPDTGGGAIYIEGSKHGALIVSSTFTGNSGANAGAVGALFAELDIYDSLFTNNAATGHDANNDDATMCSVINNGQNEVGSGGNGGAIYGDGNSFNITLCGDAILNNAAGKNAFGGGLFFTSDNWAGVLSIIDTTMTGNTGGHWTNVMSGSVTDAGSAVGTNAKSLVITNSTLQQ